MIKKSKVVSVREGKSVNLPARAPLLSCFPKGCKKTLWFLFIAGILLLQCSFNEEKDPGKESDVLVSHLRCEYLVNPLGIDVKRPRLSWILESGKRGQKQKACRILVSRNLEALESDKGDLWDSGKRESDRSIQVEYEGKPLPSQTVCFWKVRIWDKDGAGSKWSQPAFWTMGLLKPEEWRGMWIGDSQERSYVEKTEKKHGWTLPKVNKRYKPSPYLRKEFQFKKRIHRAILYASALGTFEIYINGKRVGNDYFTPGWTVYEKRINYCTYDVTDAVAGEGDNAMGVILGEGRHILSHLMAPNGKRLWFLAQLNVEFEDGETCVIGTDGSWKMTLHGPIRTSDIYNGETYDARMEMPLWASPGFDDSGWQKVNVLTEEFRARRSAFAGNPVRKRLEIVPKEITEPSPGVFVFNMGQNFAGWARLKVKGREGDRVVLRFAEILNPDGTICTKNLKNAKNTDTYILKGGGEEVWEPRFTYHGFQYVEVTGYPGKLSRDAVTGIVLHAAAPIVGSFECSNSMLNRLYECILWSQRSNYFDVPTDCPQRGERLGWAGDAQIFMRTGAYNMDVSAFFSEWLRTFHDNQYANGEYPVFSPARIRGSSAGWSDAPLICTWLLNQIYGDTRMIERHYPTMVEWINFLKTHIDRMARKTKGFDDWLNVDAKTPGEVVLRAYYARSCFLMAEMAKTIHREAETKEYEDLFRELKQTFIDACVTDDGKIKGDTQTAYLLALAFDLLPERLRGPAAGHLVERIKARDWHLSTGFLGVPLLLPVLTDVGRIDLAYQLLTSESFPSWGNVISQGATTLWEMINFRLHEDRPLISFNHYAYGSVGQWLFSTVAGIESEEPGFKRIRIHPQPGGNLEYGEAKYNSIHGLIASRWELSEGHFTLHVTIPANTTAKIYVPSAEGSPIIEGGKPAADAEGVNFLRFEKGNAVFQAGSGTYRFEHGDR